MTGNTDNSIFDDITGQTSEPALQDDLLMEEILCNLNNTPLGQVLKKLASLPEIRQDKVIGLRRQLTRGEYLLDRRIDDVVEKVLEELEG